MSVTVPPIEGPAVEEPSEKVCDVEETSLSEDQIFHLLQNERRRNVLRYLKGTEDAVRMRDIAEQVAAWEHDTTVQALTSDQRQRVYIPLYQAHLPKLDKEGIIDYKQSRGIVERTPLANRLDQYLHPVDDEDEESDDAHAWEDYYLGASGFGMVLLIGAALDLSVLSMLSGFALSVVILMMFTALTVTQAANS